MPIDNFPMQYNATLNGSRNVIFQLIISDIVLT